MSGHSSDPKEDEEYLYTVLNLPATASDHEIRERYMQLSVAFHPDKQRDEARKEAATKQFFEIQSAYEVLSDPLRRQAYDLLGTEGLKLVKALDLDGLSKEQIKLRLLAASSKSQEAKLEELVKPRTRVMLALDASSTVPALLKATSDASDAEETNVKILGCSVQHAVEKQVRQGTSLSLSARAGGPASLLGTVRHQFSPRYHCQECVITDDYQSSSPWRVQIEKQLPSG